MVLQNSYMSWRELFQYLIALDPEVISLANTAPSIFSIRCCALRPYFLRVSFSASASTLAASLCRLILSLCISSGHIPSKRRPYRTIHALCVIYPPSPSSPSPPKAQNARSSPLSLSSSSLLITSASASSNPSRPLSPYEIQSSSPSSTARSVV